jgi:peroxiredoxin
MTLPSSDLLGELDRFRTHFEKRVGPAVAALIKSATGELAPRADRVIASGQGFPKVTSLVDHQGRPFDLSGLLATQKAVVFFYRGNWCPYCRLTLRAFEDAYSLFQATGTALVAVSPELPAYVAETIEQHDLTYTMLSDRKARLTRALGLDYVVPQALRPLFTSASHALPDRNGTDDWMLPLTAALIVEPPGLIRDRFISPDYTKRTELSAALSAVQCS